MTSIPQSPQEVYTQSDPKTWDPYSRADRLGRVHDYCVHSAVDDNKLRQALNFMEAKVEASIAKDTQSEAELVEKDKHRNLFNYRHVSLQKKREKTETGTSTKFSHVSEYVLNCIQISELALSRGFQRAAHRCAYYRKQIEANNWLERQFLASQSEITNTFLFSFGLEKNLQRLRLEGNDVATWRLPWRLSEGAITESLNQLGGASLFQFDDIVTKKLDASQEELMLSSSKREALMHISHEISENAMSHGVNSLINPNCAQGNVGDFGRVFIFQTSTETYSDQKIASVGIFPRTFSDYHLNSRRRKGQRQQKYRVLTFFDTGLGIQEHLKNYGGTGKKNTIHEILEQNLTARSIRGSGQGLAKMIMFANGLSAFLSITTSDGTFTHDGVKKDSTNISDQRIFRGTLVSIFLPDR